MNISCNLTESQSVEINLVKLVMYQPFQLQLANAAFFLKTAMIVDGTVFTRAPVKTGDVALMTPTTTALIL